MTQQIDRNDRATGPDPAGTAYATALPCLETFAQCVGELFTIESAAGNHPVALELVTAGPLPAQPGMPRARPFVLLFRGPEETSLGQGMVRLSHPRVGPVELFLVPVIDGGDGKYFEAVFN